MVNKLFCFTSALIISLLITPVKTFAHGVVLDYEKVDAIALIAQYDTGEPMSNAQVVVYAPNNPDEPYLQGVADENGNFTFTPDKTITGNWTVRVRTAGHGSIINIPVESTSETVASENTDHDSNEISTENNTSETQSPTPRQSSSPNTSQRLLMAVSGVWGFVGTALFFSRSKKM
ncbi:hypothetical protein Cyast_2090 [Cyanobacterium stanieri PCC 7202]|uniref:Carboxypeptidase regulatory-like domain-containing protein n=1 Tax=Cyanobacterium stanieri (strain ATCC 29140 / PCC 7202) TaxID=292563 RepID=K9YNP2_CYASC|nr:hypothetical protein Cyast_2090 [Cyanobacterium stanieri PCC 7202]